METVTFVSLNLTHAQFAFWFIFVTNVPIVKNPPRPFALLWKLFVIGDHLWFNLRIIS